MATTSPTTSAASSTLKSTSLVTALGGGSGIDMAALASNLATAQFEGRNARLTERSDKLNTQISTASNIKSMMLALDTSLGNLVRSGDLARTPSVANSAVASASLSGTSQPQGSYSLEVTQLAGSQSLASGTFASSASPLGAGTLTLRFGTVAGSTFSEDTGHAAVAIDIAGGATLADVAKAINARKAGVTAYVANTASGAQLVLKGAEGAANGFIVEASGDPGLANLAWSPGGGTGTLLATARDAAFRIDGLDYAATSNTVTDAIPGVKLQLATTNAGAPTNVSFNNPSDSISDTMRDLTDALNELMTAVNAATGIGGDLANDGGARALKRSLASLAGTAIMPNATGAAKTLADLGLKTQRDGTFALDTARLAATMAADPEGVAAMFTNGVNGVYATMNKLYRNTTSTTNTGSLGGSISRYTKQLGQITEDKGDLVAQQEALRARLASQFTVSESRIGSFKSTLTMLENQIAQWNKSD